MAYLQKILGEAGFAIIRRAIIIEIRTTFKIEQSHLDLNGTIELARKNYILEDINPEIFRS